LFQVVNHGLKFTGMPEWPVRDRDDEVWAMVAFLKKMPELDEQATCRSCLAIRGRLPPSRCRTIRQEVLHGSLTANNRKPKPFVWTATAGLILGKVQAVCERTNPSQR